MPRNDSDRATLEAQPGATRILIAGGTGNVGLHLVREQLAAGATVLVASRSPERLAALEQAVDGEQRDRLVLLPGDLTDERAAPELLERAGRLHGVVASLGGLVAAPRVIEAPRADLQRALDNYVLAHFSVARAVIPALRERGGRYVMINGPLAFRPMFAGAGLVSIATAAQAMLARVLMEETAGTGVRVNELVIYSSFGRGGEDQNEVTGADIGRCVAYLLSDRGTDVRGETIHLRSRDALPSGV